VDSGLYAGGFRCGRHLQRHRLVPVGAVLHRGRNMREALWTRRRNRLCLWNELRNGDFLLQSDPGRRVPL